VTGIAKTQIGQTDKVPDQGHDQHFPCGEAMEKALTMKLNQILTDDLDEISPELRVTSSFSLIARAFDKDFSKHAN